MGGKHLLRIYEADLVQFVEAAREEVLDPLRPLAFLSWRDGGVI